MLSRPAVVRRLRSGGGRALFAATDVTVAAEAERLVRVAVAEFGKLDGAFNNAGGVKAGGHVQSIDGAAWHADLDTPPPLALPKSAPIRAARVRVSPILVTLPSGPAGRAQ